MEDRSGDGLETSSFTPPFGAHNGSDDSPTMRRCDSLVPTMNTAETTRVPAEPKFAAARKWYEGYKRKDTKGRLKEKIFRVWQMEHGRRVRVGGKGAQDHS